MPDLTQLRAFLAVARHRNFTRAASELHVVQQAVSKSVAGLESQLGVRLLQRTTREVGLTPAGRALVASATSAMAALDDAFAEASAVGRGLAGTMHVGVTPGVGTALHPQIAAAVACDAPQLQVLIHESRFPEAVTRLRDAELDLVITRTGAVPDDLHRAELVPTPAVVIVPMSHPLADRDHVAVSDLTGRQLQLWNPPEHPYSAEILQRLADAGAQVEVVVAGVVGGGGPAILPEGRFVLRSIDWPAASDQRTLRLDPPGLQLPLRLVWASDALAPVVERVCRRLGTVSS